MSLSAPYIMSDKWSSVKVTAPGGGYTAGLLTKVQSVVMIIVEAALVGAEAVGIYRCEHVKVAKDTTTGNTFAVGDRVYYSANKAYNNANKPTGAVLCGFVKEAAVAADTMLEIDLDGTLGIVS